MAPEVMAEPRLQRGAARGVRSDPPLQKGWKKKKKSQTTTAPGSVQIPASALASHPAAGWLCSLGSVCKMAPNSHLGGAWAESGRVLGTGEPAVVRLKRDLVILGSWGPRPSLLPGCWASPVQGEGAFWGGSLGTGSADPCEQPGPRLLFRCPPLFPWGVTAPCPLPTGVSGDGAMGNWDWDGAGRSLAAQRGLEMHEGEESWERQRLSSHWGGRETRSFPNTWLWGVPHAAVTPPGCLGAMCASPDFVQLLQALPGSRSRRLLLLCPTTC